MSEQQITPVETKNPFSGLGGGEGAYSAPKRRLPTQTIILLLVVAVSGVALMWMRREGLRAGVTLANVNIDYKEADAEKAKTYDRIMTDLARIQTPLDVALGEFGRSPFMLETQTTVVTERGQVIEDPNAAAMRALAEAGNRAKVRQAELDATVGSMRLNSVMGGATPLARIDGEFVSEGDVIGEVFTVEKIEGLTVTLTAEGHTYILTMEPKGISAPKKSPVKVGKPNK